MPEGSVVRGARWNRTGYLVVYLGLSLAFCWPLLAQPYAGGTGDWDQHTFYYASVLRSAAYGQLPFWNPWYCGGNVLWQNPQASLISPVYVLAAVIPLALAMKINIIGHYLAACVGMHLLVRRIVGVRSPLVTIYCVSLFVCSGGLALHVRAGHTNFLPAFLLPLLVNCFFLAAGGRWRQALAGAAIVAIAILNGGSHVVPLAAVLLGGLGFGAIVFGRTLKPMVAAALILLAGCAFAAPKLIPAALLVRSADVQDRRPVKRPDYMSFEMLGRALADGSQGAGLKLSPGVQRYAWHEYGNYLGWFGAGLSAASALWILAFRRRREHWREAAAATAFVLAVLLAAGEFASFAPATLLRSLPLFSNFRIPSRHILLVPLVGAACLAFLARALESRPWSRGLRRAIEVGCVVAVCQIALVNRENFRDVFIMPPVAGEVRSVAAFPPTVAEREPPVAALSRMGENSNFVRSMMEGISALNCYEQLVVRRIAVPGPAVLLADEPTALSAASFTPNRVTANVAVGADPVRVVLNQNFADGWSSSAGPVERDPVRGRPSVVLAPGFRGTVALAYSPPGLLAGLAVALLAVGLSLLAWRGAGRGR